MRAGRVCPSLLPQPALTPPRFCSPGPKAAVEAERTRQAPPQGADPPRHATPPHPQPGRGPAARPPKPQLLPARASPVGGGCQPQPAAEPRAPAAAAPPLRPAGANKRHRVRPHPRPFPSSRRGPGVSAQAAPAGEAAASLLRPAALGAPAGIGPAGGMRRGRGGDGRGGQSPPGRPRRAGTRRPQRPHRQRQKGREGRRCAELPAPRETRPGRRGSRGPRPGPPASPSRPCLVPGAASLSPPARGSSAALSPAGLAPGPVPRPRLTSGSRGDGAGRSLPGGLSRLRCVCRAKRFLSKGESWPRLTV